MLTKIISWNVRGVNGKGKRDIVRGMIRKWRPQLVCLQETKVSKMEEFMIRSLWGIRKIGWEEVPAIDTREGIVVLWNSGNMTIEDKWVGKHTVSINITDRTTDLNWCFTGVYCPCDEKGRQVCWEELEEAAEKKGSRPWIIGGDFNAVVNRADRNRVFRSTEADNKLIEFINNKGLLNLNLEGGKYTWSNLREQPVFSRIDRFLCEPKWLQTHAGINQRRLDRVTSDHWPISLELSDIKWGPTPFRFVNAWLRTDSFKENVAKWWNENQEEGCASFRVSKKVQHTKRIIKDWRKQVFEAETQEKENLIQEITRLDEVEEKEGILDVEDMRKRMLLKVKINELLSREEAIWRQKSREIWLKEGDRNTGYFHNMATLHRNYNMIRSMHIKGEVTENIEEIKEGTKEFYEELYTELAAERVSIEGMNFKKLRREEAEWLERPFGEEEVWEAVRKCGGDKAPGPDGMTMAFYQQNWATVKEDIIAMMGEFHKTGKFVRSINSTFLVLIPKKQGANQLKDFRPISLVGSLYKIIAKVLAGRLKKYLPGLISEQQHAFIGGRQILDAVLIANEVVDSQGRSGQGGIVCKLDMEKAYDHLNWKCILAILGQMGFQPKWIKWIETCISTTSFSILINGSPSTFFQASRGVRQGDPLSPLLFLLGMEVLSNLLNKAKELKWITGFRMKPEEDRDRVTNLLFANDAIVFCGSRKREMLYLKGILNLFEEITGLRVNLQKSNVAAIGPSLDTAVYADILGCGVVSMPMTYLGLPLGGKRTEKEVWSEALNRMQKRLAGWKKGFLSKGGRLILIKSVMASIPIYMLSLFKIPTRVGKEMEKCQRDFLWGSTTTTRKFHLVKWDKVKRPLNKGGLGIRSVSVLNKALLGKWLWRFANEKTIFWRRVLATKYGVLDRGRRTTTPQTKANCSLWRDIMKE